MKKVRIKEMVEIVAMFSIVASLIFVGMQLLLDREVASTESVAKASEGRKYMAELIADNAEIWTQGLEGEFQSEADKVVFYAIAEALRMDIYGSWYRAERLEHIKPDQFLSTYALNLVQYPGLMEHWESHKEFQGKVRELNGGPSGAFELEMDKVLEELQGRVR